MEKWISETKISGFFTNYSEQVSLWETLGDFLSIWDQQILWTVNMHVQSQQ